MSPAVKIDLAGLADDEQAHATVYDDGRRAGGMVHDGGWRVTLHGTCPDDLRRLSDLLLEAADLLDRHPRRRPRVDL